MKDFKKLINNYRKELLIIALSIIVLIIGSFTIGFFISLVLVIIANLIYFGKDILNLIQGKNKLKKLPKGKKTIKSTRSNKVIKSTSKKNTKNAKNSKVKHKTKRILKKVLLGLIIAACIGFVLLIIAGFLFCFYIVENAPDFNPDKLYKQEPTIIYDINGNEIDRIGSEKRITIEYNEIPEVLINAIIATEDSKFFQHNGVDIKRFTKASLQQLMGIDAGGASTITMQLSKNTYTSKNATGIEGIIRKFTDVYIAVFKIESTYTKEDILKFYVNSYFMGGGYGVEQTSLTYFGKSAKDLNLAEAAMIAGLFQAPGTYNPYTNPEATEKRRQTVLNLMLRHGYITKDEYDIAKSMTVDKIVKKTPTSTENVTEYQSFIDQVVYEVKQKTGKDPYVESMKIYTTMDPAKQKYVTSIMNGYDEFGNLVYEWENDLVKAGVAVIDVNTGAVVALGGGRNITARNSLNYASQIKRQIGSTAKPLYDYAPAIEYLNWNTYSIVADEPITYSDGTKINNWDGGFQGFETMRTALKYSRNIPALKAFKANNKTNILSFVTSLGLSPEAQNGSLHEAHAIGGYTGESAMTMAAAYSAFANGGYYTKPYTFTKIEFNDGTKFDNIQTRTKVMSEETAYLVTSMLIDTAQYALGWWANINNQQYGAKTGTTNFDEQKLAAKGLLYSGAVNDLWTVGFNTDYAIGVWYGYDEFDGVHYNLLSSGQHERLFQAVGRGIFTSNKQFKVPDGVSWVTLENGCPTACLPSAYTPDSYKITELFISGTEPTTVSDRFDTLEDVSNLKATSSGSTVTLTWSAVKTPRALDSQALTEYYRSTFENDGYLNNYVNQTLSTNKAIFGTLGYNVYVKDNNGSLTLLGYTKDPTYKINNQSGNKTYVVKTAYSNFTANMSNGKTVSIKLNGSSSDNNDNSKETFIKQLYTNCVGRNAKQDEINTWSTYQSASTIAYNICNSDESSNKYNSADSAIPAFYKAILGRNPSTDEITNQTSKFNNGRIVLLKDIVNSNEFKTYCNNHNLTHTSI